MSGGSQGGFASAGADPDEAQRRIEQWAQGFADKAQRYQEMQAQTEQVRLTAASPDGRVKVTVRADGSVTDLTMTDKIRSMAPAELSTQILTTMRKAQADIATKVSEVMTEHLGDEDAQTRSLMLNNLRERFPEQDEETEAEEAPSKFDLPDEGEPEPPKPAAGPPAAGPTPKTGPAPDSPTRKRPRGADDGDDFPDDFDPLRD